jgi:HlyD family secretion protein
MRSRRVIAAVLGAAALAVVALLVAFAPAEPTAPIGMVRMTEIRIAPEISGRVAHIRIKAGDTVRAGQVLAELDNPELAAALAEAKAVADEARAARARVYAGPRQEQVDILGQEVRKAQSDFAYAQQTLARIAALGARQVESAQNVDKSSALARAAKAAVAGAEARYAEAQHGPTAEERALADANVAAAQAAVSVLERRLAKTVLAAPADGIVRVIAAEPGEAVIPGRAVVTEEASGERWFGFVLREDRLRGLGVGASVTLATADGKTLAARITELRALGEYATWRAARAVGDHDLNTFFLRADPTDEHGAARLEPGMTVWLAGDDRGGAGPGAGGGH